MTKTLEQLRMELEIWKQVEEKLEGLSSWALNKRAAISCEIEPLAQHEGYLQGVYPYDVGQKVRISADAVGPNIYGAFSPGCVVEVYICLYWDDEKERRVYCKSDSSSTSVPAKYLEVVE